MKRIDSASNPFYRMCKSLLTRQGIVEHNRIIVAGRKIVPEYLKLKDLRHLGLIVSDPSEISQLAFNSSLDVYWFKRDLFHEVDEAGTKFPILVVEAPTLPPADLQLPPQGLEVVLAMSNPQNLGAALRICEAFEVERVVLLKECAHPFLPKVIRASSGSALKVRLELGPPVQSLTEQESRLMVALDLHGLPLTDFNWPKDIRIFIGEEGRGIPKELNYSAQITIPTKTGIDSLNAVSAVSIALYAYRTTIKV